MKKRIVIGVDAGCLGITDSRLQVGVYQVAYNLLKELAKIDKTNTYLLYSFDPIDKNILRTLGERMRNKVLRPKTGWMSVRLPAEFLIEKPDVFLALSQAMPPYHPFKTIGFVHGLDLVKNFHTYGNAYRKLKNNTEFLLKHAEQIVVSSKFLADAINADYGAKHVSVLPLGASNAFRPDGEKFTLDKPYFLFVGTLKPSKNIPRILKGFYKFLRSSRKDYYLVIVGSDYWLDAAVKSTIEKLDLQNSVKILGFVKNSDLPQYYRGATALVSPSLYEGFGLPLLEAMSCGCPVIASDNRAERDILGDAGILINPLKEAEVSNALHVVAGEKGVRYHQKGIERAKKFTWKRYAEGIYAIISDIAHT